jgi:hypothetical protein
LLYRFFSLGRRRESLVAGGGERSDTLAVVSGLPAYLYFGNGMRANFFGIVVLAGMLASSVLLSTTG